MSSPSAEPEPRSAPVGPGPPSGGARVGLGTVAAQWTRIGLTGFGGPPSHIALLRRLVVNDRQWIDAREIEDAIAACNLLPGPASTQLAIYCARRVGGVYGAIVGGLGFIVPGVVIVTALSAVFLASAPPAWIRGAGAGAGSAVAAVALQAAAALLGPSWARVSRGPGSRARWVVYAGLGVVAGSVLGPFVVVVLLVCGLGELVLRASGSSGARVASVAPGALWGLKALVAPLAAVVAVGGVGALAWVSFKVGALSYGGGFVIIPLIRGDAVSTYHWVTSAQFLSVVALGQVTPGPVVATVAAIGYAARGVGGAALASVIAFAPSFLFVVIGAPQFDRLRTNARAQAFLDGAGPAAIGAILGAAIPLAGSLTETWQFVILAGAVVALVPARRGVVSTLVSAAVIGAVIGAAGGSLPH